MANKRRAKKQPRRPRSSLVTKLIVLVMLAVMGWQLQKLANQVEEAMLEKERCAAQVAEMQRLNDVLTADILEGPTDEKIEQIARDTLGLVKPGEYIFEPAG